MEHEIKIRKNNPHQAHQRATGGNGFTDGVMYSGYTLHVVDENTRYVVFNIENGATKVFRLQAKFHTNLLSFC